ncbi:MAG: Fic family protein [Deltaproteobacteria bacterium]
MTVEIVFLSVSDVTKLHREGLNRWGGGEGLRSPELLASAVAMPEQSWGGEYLHEDLFAMAAAYAFHIAENQPFVGALDRNCGWPLRTCASVSKSSICGG